MRDDPVVTVDLSEFGYREIRLAIELLEGYMANTSVIGDGVKLCFNRNSGSVFLSDEDFNVAMMNGDKIEQWFYCPNCGNEGFQEEYDFDEETHLCKNCKPVEDEDEEDEEEE